MRNKPLMISLTIMVLFTSGCVPLTQRSIGRSLALSYDEVSKKWDPLKEGYGRVIIYFPHIPFMAALPLYWSGRPWDSMVVFLDSEHPTMMADKSFVFADVKPGKHVVSYEKSSHPADKNEVEFDIAVGETIYIQIKAAYYKTPVPDIVPEEEALKSLKSSKHCFRDVLPFNI